MALAVSDMKGISCWSEVNGFGEGVEMEMEMLVETSTSKMTMRLEKCRGRFWGKVNLNLGESGGKGNMLSDGGYWFGLTVKMTPI